MHKRITFLLLILVLFQSAVGYTQDSKDFTWWNPATNEFPVIEGQAWPAEMKGGFDRLPERAEKLVRKDVWELAENAAGLIITFFSNSPEIVVRYKVSDRQAFPHMPATGVSGVDLYGIGKDGNWLWCKGNYSFGDTITYRFRNFDSKDSLIRFMQKAVSTNCICHYTIPLHGSRSAQLPVLPFAPCHCGRINRSLFTVHPSHKAVVLPVREWHGQLSWEGNLITN